jgi:glycosyltransferase involved in cell wall biosynthesis
LRVGIDSRELLGHTTGVGRYLAELVARWTRDPALAACHLVLFAPGPLDPDAPWMGRGGARVSGVHVPGGKGTAWEQWSLPKAARRERLSLFFAPAYTMPLALAVPRVVSIHDVSFAAHPEWFPWRQGLRRRLLAKASARRARAVLTLTGFSRDEIERRLGIPAEKISVVSPAVDSHPAFGARPPETQAVSPGSRPPVALFVGSIFNRRHVPAMIRAFAGVTRRVPGARLEIVGENRTHPFEDVGAVAARCGIASAVTLRDYVDEATLASLYASARAFVFLSEYEGFGLTPLEAMARGVPAIVLDTAVAREAYGDDALYVSRPDAPELADEITRLFTDAAWHDARAAAGRRAASRYSWDRAAKDTFAVLARHAG